MNSAHAALRAIDREANADAVHATVEATRVRTPEMRLVQQHYYAMGEDDLKRAIKADPRQHLYGCKCPSCDTAERICPTCEKPIIGLRRLALHLEGHRKNARRDREREQAAWRKRVEPAGLGFVEALLGDPERANRLDLRALRAFEERLFAAHGGKRRLRRLGASRVAIEDALADPSGTSKLSSNAPNPTAVVVHRLALLAGVAPNAVVTALIAWGIEKFADDARALRTVTPHVEQRLTTGEAPVARNAFPDAEESAQ